MTIGIAYGFFNCTAAKDQIEEELPTIRVLAQTPHSLELTLTEDLERLQTQDSALRALIHEAQEAGIRYCMEARYPGATHKEAADELSTILNQAYQSPLYQKNEPFEGEIVYHDGKQYVFQE